MSVKTVSPKEWVQLVTSNGNYERVKIDLIKCRDSDEKYQVDTKELSIWLKNNRFGSN